MNSRHNQQQPAWDFMRFLDPSSHAAPGHGVDHQPPSGGPWAHHPHAGYGGPWGAGRPHRGGPGGRPGRHDRGYRQPSAASDHEDEAGTRGPRSVETEKSHQSERTVGDGEPVPDPAEVTPAEDDADGDADAASPPPYGPGRRGGRRGCGRSRRGGCGPRHGDFRHHQDPFSGPAPAWPAFHGMMQGFVHPLMRDIQDQAQRYFNLQNDNHARDAAAGSDAASFTPPVDVFNTTASYIVHVALPGARKEDVGVSWDPDTSRLRIAGVVHRPGDELLLATLASGERRVGLFERHVTLPPAGAAYQDSERDAVDAENISAKMDNGILVVKVPKLEKEWTQIRRVDIE